MPASWQQSEKYEPELLTKTKRLIVGRLALLVVLQFANLLRGGGELVSVFPIWEEAGSTLTLFGLLFGLSLIYFTALRSTVLPLHQVRIQFVVDVLLITFLVWQTGILISPYVTLYVVLVSVAGFFLGKSETLFFSIGAAATFTCLAVLSFQNLLAGGDQPASRVLQIVGINVVAILLVGLLAARLSERRRLSEELKYSEALFADLHILHERIVESVDVGLVVTDLNRVVYAFNAAAEAIIGIKATEALGKYLDEVLGKDLGISERLVSKGPLTQRWEPIPFERNFIQEGEKRVTAAGKVIPLLDRAGNTKGVIVTLRDITHMRQLENDVRRADRLAAVGRMAAGLAHEVRNPLGAMSSALQFLQERDSRAPEESALMGVALRESERMNSIITNFLAFARPGTNGNGDKRVRVDICKALADCLTLIKHSPEITPDHELSAALPNGPIWIEGDETQLKQVFWNVARNAIDAMPGEGELQVGLKVTESHAIIEFRDDGRGMTETELAHAFEPFNSSSGGMGLGLSIVYKIVRDHRGDISIDSETEVGTVVRIQFPLLKTPK